MLKIVLQAGLKTTVYGVGRLTQLDTLHKELYEQSYHGNFIECPRHDCYIDINILELSK